MSFEGEDLQKPNGKEHEEQDLLPLWKPSPCNHRHWYHVDHEVGGDMHVGIGPPDSLVVAISAAAELELEVPEGFQRYTGCQHRDADKDVVDHDKDKEIESSPVDAGKGPDAEEEQQNGHL